MSMASKLLARSCHLTNHAPILLPRFLLLGLASSNLVLTTNKLAADKYLSTSSTEYS